MQRKKLKAGTEYGHATYRDWYDYRSNVRRVQLLDAGGWRTVPYYREQLDTTDPETVQVPGSAPDNPLGGERLTVPKRYRRKQADPFSKGQGNLVLVRIWEEDEPGKWGEPRTAETRHLVDTWEEAVRRVDASEQARNSQRTAAEQLRMDRLRRGNKITERMLALGIELEAKVEASRFSWGTDVVSVPADKLEQLLIVAERGPHSFETEGEQGDVITSCSVCGQQRNSWVHG